jgi:2-keto-3-deoxy-galactonokinase
MASEKHPTELAGARESALEGEAGDTRPRDSGISRLSPALTRAIVEQLLQHGRELGRREMIDLVGSRYGWKREVSDPGVPAPASLDA